MDKEYYYKKLYPLQDKVLRIINDLDTGFYLTGGTASSRGYLHHRFSDDIDLFVNDDHRFGLWTDRIIHSLHESEGWSLDVLQRDERFVRFSLKEGDLLLKIELINDVPSHIGTIRNDAILGMLDSAENILANKVTAAIDRQEPKDLADIWGFSCKMGVSLISTITDAHSKAAGIFPADLARVLCTATKSDWEAIRWIEAPSAEIFLDDLQKLGESLII
ncbi:MAG: nucleotidyl transferase AbiEii/AbiGii toxin family protein [Deltaproteobacteria bacterium]|nr:nucleotidyl transferase AbiEii/AbiGii toxin family protein [Deltaproteobacteria bacterium]